MKKYILIAMLLTTSAYGHNFCGNLEQGGLIIENGKLIAFDRDAKSTKKYNIKKISWDIQHVNGVPQKTVTPNPEHQALIKKESAQVKQAYTKKITKQYWKNGFIKPLDGRISGKYGGQRIYNGTPKNPHLGVDIARPTGTEVVASGDGVIVGVIENGFYNGNLIVINHGDDLKLFMHILIKTWSKKVILSKRGKQFGLFAQQGAQLAHISILVPISMA